MVAGVLNAKGECPPGSVLGGIGIAMVHVWIAAHPCGPFAALEGEGEHGHLPALPLVAHQALGGHAGVGEEGLVELAAAGELHDGPHLDAGTQLTSQRLQVVTAGAIHADTRGGGWLADRIPIETPTKAGELRLVTTKPATPGLPRKRLTVFSAASGVLKGR